MKKLFAFLFLLLNISVFATPLLPPLRAILSNNDKPFKGQKSKSPKKKKHVPIPYIAKPIKLGISTIEKKYYELYKDILCVNSGKACKPLKQYGYDFFINRKPNPNLLGSVSQNYILGPGDVITIYIYGAPSDILGFPSEIKDVAINREGIINLPLIGTIPVWGKTLSQLDKILEAAISKKFKNVRVSVSLDKLRQFSVYVSGFVRYPGPVIVNQTYTVVDALILAGGILRNGSLRDIVLTREDGTKINIDLYKLLLEGKPIDIHLKDGDTLYVPPIGNTVAIAGAVKSPGIYEIKKNENLLELLNIIGGPQFFAFNKNIKLISVKNGTLNVSSYSLNDEKFLKSPLKNGDFIYFGSIAKALKHTIIVRGAVLFPGVYSTSKTPDLKALIEKARISSKTNLNYATLIENKDVITFSPEDVINGTYNHKLHTGDEVIFYDKWIFKPIVISGKYIKKSLKVNYYPGITILRALKNVKYTIAPSELKAYVFHKSGKIDMVYLRNLLYRGTPLGDVKLYPGDIVLIKKVKPTDYTRSITILGEVKRPGVYNIKNGERLYDAILEAGGYKKDAYPKAIVFIRPSIQKLQYQNIQQAIVNLENSLMNSSQGRISATAENSQEAQSIQNQLMQEQVNYINYLIKTVKKGLGRISLDIPPKLNELKNSTQNILLEPGDYIYIPPKPQYVLITGSVYNQIAMPYIPNKTLKWYVSQVGGFKEGANKSGVYIIRANGRIVSAKQQEHLFGFFGNNFYNTIIKPGDTIVIPPKFEANILWIPLIRDITQIIFQSLSAVALIKYVY